MKFKKEDLQELVFGGEPDGIFVVSDEIIDTTRWSIVRELIFKKVVKEPRPSMYPPVRTEHSTHTREEFYRIRYNTAATEMQSETPFQDEDDEIECVQVWPHETKIIVYKPKRPE
jgi:hypothetical protein